MIKNRDLTEKKILDAVGRIVKREGFEAVGVNAVAAESGVSKVLIYRYFNTIDQLLAQYIEQNDFWLNFENSFKLSGNVKEDSRQIFREYIYMLRNSPALRKLYRWELMSNHPSITELRKRREESALKIVDAVCKLSGEEFYHVACISALVTASVSYLSILSDSCSVYNSLKIDSDSGWEKLLESIDLMLDRLFNL